MSIQGRSKTRKNYKDTLGEVVRFALAQDYLEKNPLIKITRQEARAILDIDPDGDEISILKVGEAEALMLTAAETHHQPYGERTLGMAPAIAISLFCGLRTEEVKKLDWADVDLEKMEIKVGSAIAKTRKELRR